VIGVIAALACFWACTWLRPRFNYDDSFGVRGVGGMTGIMLASLCAAASIGGTRGLLGGSPQWLLIRLSGIAAPWAGPAGSLYVRLKRAGVFGRIRVALQREQEASIFL
jgi:ammonium transporter, Amt family